MRFFSVISSSVATLLVALSIPGVAAGTVVIRLSLRQLAERSDAVAYVRVGDAQSRQGDNTPFRVTELRVLEALRGANEGEVLDLWQRGDRTTSVVGDGVLERGDEGLVFLVRRGPSRVYLTALAQSFWRRSQGRDGAAVAVRDLSGLHLITRDRSEVRAPDVAAWEDLRDRVASICRELGR